jgi:putative acetyltransferase
MSSLTIRPETLADQDGVRAVITRAFGQPGEAVLVDALRAASALTISLVATLDRRVVGHIAFSPITIEPAPATAQTLLGLAPLAVDPDWQGQGIGSALVEAGLAACLELGAGLVVVLGHHDFYTRFGFETALPHGLTCDYEVPIEAFMVRELIPGTLAAIRGRVHYHAAFAGV